MVFGNADPGIRYFELHCLSFGNITGRDCDRAFLGELDGVVDEILENLLELWTVSPYYRKLRGMFKFDDEVSGSRGIIAIVKIAKEILKINLMALYFDLFTL